MEKRVFSGIQPSGNLHIGNYLGAVKQWVANQNDGVNIYCVVDLHAITIYQEPDILKEKINETAALLLACGIDPQKSIFFIQSHNPDHANLAWILNCNISMGQLNRMTQYKDKSEGKEFVSAGLFDYPALMAADILLYDTTQVPVGEDQKQHVELARDTAERFNSKYGPVFILPEPVMPKIGARIMSLSDPTKKMSKSDSDKNGSIFLLDSPDDIKNKVQSATTDSGSEVVYKPDEKPGISNLIEIYSQIKGVDSKETEKEFEGKGYGEFKTKVAESLIEFVKPIQEKYKKIKENEGMEDVLIDGAEKARKISSNKLAEVYSKIGIK